MNRDKNRDDKKLIKINPDTKHINSLNPPTWASVLQSPPSQSDITEHDPTQESLTETRKIYCHNCGELGHISKNCYLPTTSYGIVLFYPLSSNSVIEENPLLNSQQNVLTNHLPEPGKKDPSVINYLLIMDRHTPDFAQIIIGNYDLENLEYLRTLVGRLTQTEAQLILTYDLRYLFTRYWNFSKKNALKMYQKQFNKSEQLFNRLKRGIHDPRTRDLITWKSLLEMTEPHWIDPDWGFPKGRRKRHSVETDLECAKREFREETGISEDQYRILEDLEPIEEIIMGSNGIQYRTIYYLAEARSYIPLFSNPFNRAQQSEVTKIGWYTYDQTSKLIRPYQEARLHIIHRVHKYLGNLYC